MRSEWATELTGLWSLGDCQPMTSTLKNCFMGNICKGWGREVRLYWVLFLEGVVLSPDSLELNVLIDDDFIAGRLLSPTSLD